ncbi:MAG: hypothetical protein C4290_06210, partial [Chloroflexota bacterium]
MVTPTGTSVRVGTLAELQHRGCTVVTAGGHTMAVFLHEGRVYALDNRCPHMGFPLSRGTVHDGLLTCHWHHARFDLASGGTLDPFADDVHTFPVRVVDGVVFVELPSDAVLDPPARRGAGAAAFARAVQGGDRALGRGRDAGPDRGHRRALWPALPRCRLGTGYDHPHCLRQRAARPGAGGPRAGAGARPGAGGG